jgi:glycerol-3-phosphate cytidylyltransferase-like family protein
MLTGLMSELEAVNKILAVAGDSPVQTLEDDYIQAILARQILTRASRKVQSLGWWFNEDEGVILIPSITGMLTLATNVISAIAKDDAGTIIQRGNRLYDRQERTYVFTENVKCDLVLALEWTELPQAAREYISDVACTQYNNDFFGAQEIKQNLQKNEGATYLIMKQEDTDARDISMLNNTRAHNIAFRNRRG